MNVFVTTLSTLNRADSNLYYVQDNNGTKKYCTGISANEAGAKYILSSETIGRIVVTGSDATYTADDMDLVNSLDIIGNMNPDDYAEFADCPPLHSNRELLFLAWSLANFLRSGESDNPDDEYESDPQMEPVAENLNAEVCFVPLMRNGSENLSGIIQAIRGAGAGEDITLFVDVQGGSRTDSYVMNAVFSILHSDENNSCRIGKVVATDFSPANTENRIIDETARYRISELVSGMNAFVRYGKAHAISSYLRQSGTQDTRIQKISEQMVRIEEAISICDIGKLKLGISSLNRHLRGDYTFDDSTASEIFRILEGEIRRDYGKLIEPDDDGNPDTLELIDWCAKKRFAHQALVILETEIPDMMYDSGILFYDPCCNERLDVYMGGGSGLKPEKAMKGETRSHYLVRVYPKLLVPVTDFPEVAGNKYPSDIKNYSKKLRAMIHEIYCTDELWGDIKIYSALEEEELTELLEKYYVLVFRRNEVSHSDECNEYRWKLETLLSEILDFTRLFRELSANSGAVSKGKVQEKKRTRKELFSRIYPITVDNSPAATETELSGLASLFGTL